MKLWITLGCVAAFAIAKTAAADDKAACLDAATEGQKLRDAHKLIEARDKFRVCAAAGCPAVVQSDCAGWLDAVEKAQPTVVFEMKDAAGGDLTGVKVAMDGKPVTDSALGAALPVDPGAHTFTFEAPGNAPVSKEIVLHEGEKGRTERVVIGAGGSGPSASSSTVSAGSPGAAVPPSESTGNGGTQRTIGLVVGGVGAAALVAGGIFGGLTIAAHSDYQKDCGSNIGAPANQCNQHGISGQSDAATKGTLSTVFFMAGGVAAAAGALLFFTAPSGSTSVQVGVGPSGAVLRGAW